MGKGLPFCVPFQFLSAVFASKTTSPLLLNTRSVDLGYVSSPAITQVSWMPSPFGENIFGIFSFLYTLTNTSSDSTAQPNPDTA